MLAVQSKEQAERWLKVIREVVSQASSNDGLEGSSSPMIQRKKDLDKVGLPSVTPLATTLSL